MDQNEKFDTEDIVDENRLHQQKKHDIWSTPKEILDTVISSAVGQKVTDYHRIVNGETNEVYDVTLETGPNVIARIHHGASARFEKERWALEQCARADVPVPTVLGVQRVETNGEILQICVETKLPGVSLDKVPFSADILRQFGVLLAKVHSVPIDGFGKLDSTGKSKFRTVAELVSKDEYIKPDEILPHFNDRPEDLAMLRQVYEVLQQKSGLYSDTKSVLIHNDLSPGHVLVKDGKISGLIDFESACGADPVQEFALWDFKFSQQYPLEYILEGYGDIKLPSTIDFNKTLNFWKIYRSMTRLRYCLKEKKPKGINLALATIKESLKQLS